MLEDGYSIRHIKNKYGIDDSQLTKLWLLYQKEGSKVLGRQPNVRADGEFTKIPNRSATNAVKII